MSTDRLKKLEQGYKAFGEADFERWSQVFDEDVVFDVSAVFWDQEPIHGREAMVKFGEVVLRAWDSLRLDVVETVEVSDERIVQRVRVHGKGRTTGMELDQEMFQMFEYSGGLLPVTGRLYPR